MNMFTNVGFATALVKEYVSIDFILGQKLEICSDQKYGFLPVSVGDRRRYVGSVMRDPENRLAFKRQSRLMGTSYDGLPLHWGTRRLREYCRDIALRIHTIGDRGALSSLRVGNVLFIGIMAPVGSNRTKIMLFYVHAVLLYRTAWNKNALSRKQAQSVLAEEVEELNILLR